jgi:predicted nucleic acid-binding protein
MCSDVARKMKAALDTNCFIDAVEPTKAPFHALQTIFSARDAGQILIMVSRHSLHEILMPETAWQLAQTASVLPYWPIGMISEQVATIEQLAGTWEDAHRNEAIQQELKKLAKSGNDIRDRGAYIDALRGGADFFVTSDRHLVGSRPAESIRKQFGLAVLTPQEFAKWLTIL